MGNSLGTCCGDTEGASAINDSNIDLKKHLQAREAEEEGEQMIKEGVNTEKVNEVKNDQYETEAKEDETIIPRKKLEQKEEEGNGRLSVMDGPEIVNQVKVLKQTDSWNMGDEEYNKINTDPADDIVGLLDGFKAPGYEVRKQAIATRNQSILVSADDLDGPGGMVFLNADLVVLPTNEHADDDTKKSVTFQDNPVIGEEIKKVVPARMEAANKDKDQRHNSKPISILVESTPAKKKRNETNFLKLSPSEVDLPKEEWIPHTDIWIQTSKGWHLATISKILNTKIEFHLKDEEKTKLVYNKAKFSSRARKVTVESIDAEVPSGATPKRATSVVQVLKKKKPADVVAQSEPTLTEHKRHEIKFAANSKDEWGVKVDFTKSWKDWTVKKVKRGKQFAEKGVQKDWQIVKVSTVQTRKESGRKSTNERVLSDETAKDIMKILKQGKACTITFQEPVPYGSISSTTPTKAKPVSTPVKSSVKQNIVNSHKKIGAVKEGYMKKQGQSRKNWRERYFKLTTDHKLSYFETNFDTNHIKQINLREAIRIEEDDGDDDWGIKLTTKSRVWYFRMIELRARDDWMQEIKKYMPQRRATVMLRVMKEGLMYKLAPGGFFGGGQVRYFVLKRNLEYFDHYGESNEKKKGEININDISIFEETDEGGEKNKRTYGMKLHTSDRTWSLYVETEQERNDWIQKIKSRKDENTLEGVTEWDRITYAAKLALKKKKGIN